MQTIVLIFAGTVTAIVQGRNFAETQPYGLIILVCILAIISSGVYIFLLIRRNDKTAKNHIIFNFSILTTASITALIFLFKSPPCEFKTESFKSNEFGILIANFTANEENKFRGSDLADQAYDAIEAKIINSNLQNTVKVHRTCEIENLEHAKSTGEKLNAKMVVWGEITNTKDLYLDLSLTPVSPIKENPALPDIIISDNLYFQTKVSEQITSYSAFLAGLAKFEEKDYAGAIYEFSLAIENIETNLNDPNIRGPQKDKLNRAIATFYTLRGDAYTANKDALHAKVDYVEALNYDKSYYLANIGLGNYYYNEGEFSLAEKEFSIVIEYLKINNPSAYYSRGNSKYNQGNKKGSISDYLAAIEYTDGDSSIIKYTLAQVYIELGQRADGIKQLKMITSASESNPTVKMQSERLLDSLTEPFEICGNKIDDDGDGVVDEGCPVPRSEVCGNGIDDDGDGKIDSVDPDCPPDPPMKLQCDDGKDNDADGLIDLDDPQCKNKPDSSESQ